MEHNSGMGTQTAISRAIASPLPYLLNGELVRLHPLRLRDFGEMEQMLLFRAKLSAPIGAGIDVLTKKTHVSWSELIEWTERREGLSYALWYALRHEWDYERCRDAVTVMFKERRHKELKEAIRQVSGYDILSNSDWPKTPVFIQACIDAGYVYEDKETWTNARVIRQLAEVYQMSPTTIGEWTLYQLKLMSKAAEGSEQSNGIIKGSMKGTPENNWYMETYQMLMSRKP